ncbi:MAG: DUF3891 family protein [Solirubrobacteraceae bacterium]
MLLRRDDRGVLAIGQLSHSWISGQLARAWGNARFGEVAPLEDVILGAQQHDLGMSAWDLAPPRNPETGLPVSFTEMPLEVSLEQWRDGPRRLLSQSRYAALLASMHGYKLYGRHNLEAAPPVQATAIRAYLNEQRAFQAELVQALRGDPAAAKFASEETVDRNSRLVWAWDLLSLMLILDWAPRDPDPVPTSGGECRLELVPTGEPGRFRLAPWPLREGVVTVRCEGRRLKRSYDTDPALSQALAAAPWETLEFVLERE